MSSSQSMKAVDTECFSVAEGRCTHAGISSQVYAGWTPLLSRRTRLNSSNNRRISSSSLLLSTSSSAMSLLICSSLVSSSSKTLGAPARVFLAGRAETVAVGGSGGELESAKGSELWRNMDEGRAFLSDFGMGSGRRARVGLGLEGLEPGMATRSSDRSEMGLRFSIMGTVWIELGLRDVGRCDDVRRDLGLASFGLTFCEPVLSESGFCSSGLSEVRSGDFGWLSRGGFGCITNEAGLRASEFRVGLRYTTSLTCVSECRQGPNCGGASRSPIGWDCGCDNGCDWVRMKDGLEVVCVPAIVSSGVGSGCVTVLWECVGGGSEGSVLSQRRSPCSTFTLRLFSVHLRPPLPSDLLLPPTSSPFRGAVPSPSLSASQLPK